MDVLEEREREVFGFFLFLCDREDGRHSGSMRRWNQEGEGDGEKSDLPERGVLSAHVGRVLLTEEAGCSGRGGESQEPALELEVDKGCR